MKRFKKIFLVFLGLLIFMSCSPSILIGEANWKDRKYENARKYEEVVFRHATEFNVNPYLVLAIITQESGGNMNQKGGGLMQVSWNLSSSLTISATNAKNQKVTHTIGGNEARNEVEANIRYGVMKLKNLQDQFNGDLNKMIQAYNFNLSGYMLKNHPQEWKDGTWLRYREEARIWYATKEKGWVESRSASSYCVENAATTNKNLPMYGDTCYIENVRQYLKDSSSITIKSHQPSTNKKGQGVIAQGTLTTDDTQLIEKKRIEEERLEQERIKQERLEQERIEQERIKKEEEAKRIKIQSEFNHDLLTIEKNVNEFVFSSFSITETTSTDVKFF